jgi:hypothetical protein
MKDQVISPFQLVHDLLIWPLNEPQKHRYLLGWRIQPTSDGNDFKIVFVHGEKFQSEFPAQKEQSPSPQIPTDTPKPLDTKVDLELLHQLMKRGVTERVSISLLKEALVSSLQAWLYATAHAGFFEKRYPWF